MPYTHITSPVPPFSPVPDVSPNVYRGASFIHTTASFRRDNIPELDSLARPASAVDRKGAENINDILSTQETTSWTLSLPISIPPNLHNPRLESLVYNISYAAFGAGNAFLQTDIVVSNGIAEIPEGIITDYSSLTFYSNYNGEETRRNEGYSPPMLNEEISSCLSSRRSFKGPDISGWCHYADHQEAYLDVPIGGIDGGDTSILDVELPYPDSHCLCLFFHVHEISRVDALRNLDVDVAATWIDGAESGRSQEMVKEVGEIRKERQKLVVAKREAEMMIRRLEESARKANEESEKRTKGDDASKKEHRERKEEILAIERRAIAEHDERTKEAAAKEADSRAKRDHAMRVGSENAILKMLIEVQKFRDDVKQYRQEEAESRKRIETESRKQMETERKAREEEYSRRVEADKERIREITEAQKKFREEVEQYRREEAEGKIRMEVERKTCEEDYARRAELEEERLRKFIESISPLGAKSFPEFWNPLISPEEHAADAKRYIIGRRNSDASMRSIGSTTGSIRPPAPEIAHERIGDGQESPDPSEENKKGKERENLHYSAAAAASPSSDPPSAGEMHEREERDRDARFREKQRRFQVLQEQQEEFRKMEEGIKRRAEERKRQDSAGAESAWNGASPSPGPNTTRVPSSRSNTVPATESWTSSSSSGWGGSSGASSAWSKGTSNTSSTPASSSTPRPKPTPSPNAQRNPSMSSSTFSSSTPLSEAERERKRDEETQKQHERFRLEQKRLENERQAKQARAAAGRLTKDDLIAMFDNHERQWAQLPNREELRWDHFPWPVFSPPKDPEALNPGAINAYISSQWYPEKDKSRTLTDRIKYNIKRWHPDRFETKLLPKVTERDKEKVRKGVVVVVRCLNDMLTKSSTNLGFL